MLNLVILTYFFSILIFITGLLGLLFIYKSYFFVIISFETLFLSININFFMFSLFLGSNLGLSIIFVVIIISAVELVIILSFIIITFKRLYNFDFSNNFKWIKI